MFQWNILLGPIATPSPFAKTWLGLLVVGCLWMPLWGMGVPFVDHYAKADYGGGPRNHAFAQDAHGRVFVANNEGMLSFDGKHFQLHPISNKTQVLAIAIGSQGRIFVGGQGEFGYFFPDDSGGLRYHSLTGKIPPAHREFADVRNIRLTEGGVYFKSLLKIFHWEWDTRTVTVHETGNILDFMGWAGDRLLINDTRDGLLSLSDGKFTPLPGGESFAGRTITSLFEMDGVTHASTLKSGLFRIGGEAPAPFPTDLDDILAQAKTTYAAHYAPGRIALGTFSQGIYIISPQGRLLQHLHKGNCLSNNGVVALHTDRLGNLWVGLENGIDYVKVGMPYEFINPDPRQDLAGHDAAVDGGWLYLATSQGLYRRRMGGLGGDFSLVRGSEGVCWNIRKVNGALYLHHHEGFFRILGDHLERVPGSGEGYRGSWVALPLPGNADALLEGTYFGIRLYPGGGRLPIEIKGFNESARIMEIEGRDIWVSHDYKGAYRLEMNEGFSEVLSLKHYDSKRGFLSDIDVNVFRLNGELVFSSERGMYRYDAATDSMLPHQRLNEIFGEDAEIRRLVQDGRGNIWYVDGKRVGYINPSDLLLGDALRHVLLPELEGSLVEHFQCVRPYDGDHVFIGTESGFIRYMPDQHPPPDSGFQALLHGVWVGAAFDSLLYGGFHQGGGPPLHELPYHGGIHFTFSSNDYGNPSKTLYASYLKGYEAGWSDWTAETARSFTNLRPGDYTFLLKARTPQGWESAEVSYSFTVPPPWYQSRLAVALYALLGLLGLYLLWAIPHKKHEQETEELRQRQKTREEAYQQQVRDSEDELMRLKNEKLQADVRHKNQELASATMHLVQKREILLKIKEDLAKARKMEDEGHVREQIRKVVRMIDQDLRLDDNWKDFERYFDQVHTDFIKRLRAKYPQLTPKDYRLCAYLKMNLSSKEIASLMNITTRSVEVSRYRLRKKIGLESNDNLVNSIMEV